MSVANQYEVGRDADALDSARDQSPFGVTGSTCSVQFSSCAVNESSEQLKGESSRDEVCGGRQMD